MIRMYVAAIFLLLRVNGALAQNRIGGRLKGDADNGMPLPGANVFIEEVEKGTVL